MPWYAHRTLAMPTHCRAQPIEHAPFWNRLAGHGRHHLASRSMPTAIRDTDLDSVSPPRIVRVRCPAPGSCTRRHPWQEQFPRERRIVVSWA